MFNVANLNKATRHLSAARLDFWEAQYLVGEKRIRRVAKRNARRALRRLDKALVQEAALTTL